MIRRMQYSNFTRMLIPSPYLLIRNLILLFIPLLFSQVVSAATFSISTPDSTGKFTLTWSGVRTFAELYEVVNGSSQKIGQYPAAHSISYTKPVGTYTYILVDVQAYGCGSCPGGAAYNRTNIQKTVVVTPNTPPTVPSFITVIPNDFTRSFGVSWGESTGVPSRYELERNGANVYTGLGKSTTVTGNTIGTGYIFRVRACNAAGCSDWRTANSSAIGSVFDVPATNVTGTFSIGFLTPSGYTHVSIEERRGNGSWGNRVTMPGSTYRQYFPSMTRDNDTYYFRLYYCIYNAQTSTCTLQDEVKSILVNQPAPTVSVTLSPATVNEGGVTTLTWDATRAKTCTVPGLGDNAPTSGNVQYPTSSILKTNTVISIGVSCLGGGGAGAGAANLSVIAINDYPTISAITSIAIDEDTSSNAISFTVGDEETAAGSLDVAARSDNPDLIPNSKLLLAGSGADRTVTIVPQANQNGSAKIYIDVTDEGKLTSTTSFTVTVRSVNDAPVISTIAGFTMNEGAERTVNFTVSDIDSAIGDVTVPATSSGGVSMTPTLTDLGIISGLRTYSLTLKAGLFPANGTMSADIDVTVHAAHSPAPATSKFKVTVNNLNPALWIEETSTIGEYYVAWNYGSRGVKIFEDGNDATSAISGTEIAAPSGKKLVTREKNKTYNYKIRDCITGQNGSVICPTYDFSPKSITVQFPQPTVTASFDKPSINESNAGATNTTAEFKWESTNATTCRLSGGIIGDKPVSGKIAYTAPAVVIANKTESVKVVCTGRGGDDNTGETTAAINLIALNDTPTVTITSTVNAKEDEVFYIPFTAKDEETDLASLDLIVTSSDVSKVPLTNIQIDKGTNPPRLIVTPALNEYGSVSIRLKAKDNANAPNSESTEVTSNITVASVDDAPVISAITELTMNEGSERTFNFTVTDNDSAIGNVTVPATSSGGVSMTPTLTDLGIINGLRTYSLKLKAGGFSSNGVTSADVAVTINVPHSPSAVTHTFNVKVNNLNPALWIEETSTIGEYYVSWAYGSQGVKILEGSNDITSFLTGSEFAPNSGKVRVVKTVEGTYKYSIKDCIYGRTGTRVCDYINDTASIEVSFDTPPDPDPVRTVPVLDSPPTNETGEFTVSWTTVPAASLYRLYENGKLIQSSLQTSITFSGSTRKANGNYQYKVVACVSETECGKSSNFKNTYVGPAGSSGSRTVIFIHTDLLGSPAAETDMAGNKNE